MNKQATKLHHSSPKSKVLLPFIGMFVLLTAISLSTTGCFEESFESNVSVPLEISVDTLRFDTVFTSVGSVTRSIRIFNPTDQNINVSSISLDKGAQSMFRLNIDGVPGNEAEEIPLLAQDSLYIFVEVTVDPDQPLSVSPFVISEFLSIRSGSETKQVTLEAWGQNANYFPSRDAQGQIISLTCGGGQLFWDDPKPYVIYGLLIVDSCDIVLPPGTEVFVHGGIARLNETIFSDGGLIFLEGGRLLSNGTFDAPVMIQGDRLESGFQDTPGQWAGLRFFENSTGNVINNTIIKNSIVGVRADSAARVNMSNTSIFNTSNVGVIGIHAEIQADNCLIHSNGPQSVAMIYGGDYTYRHCTIANYGNQSAAVFMDNFTCLNEECSSVATNPVNVSFYNSIIMGSNEDEIDINDISGGEDPGLLRLLLDHTIVKVGDTKMDFPEDACMACLEHDDEPIFLNEFMDDYTLDTMSLARDQGVFIDDLSRDLLGNPRDQETPDLGCFEFLD